MPFEVSPATDNDFARFIPSLFGVMGTAGFVAALWPNNQTEEGQKRATERFMTEKNVHPGISWVKVVDTSTTEANNKPKIVGIAQWATFEPGKKYPEVPELVPDGTWPNDLDKEYAIQMWESYIRPRRKVLQEATGPVVNLQILCVWPAYWRQGAGGMLVKWGCSLADQINATCVVESSGAGQQLYERWGFELQEDFALEAGEKFSERLNKGRVRFMVRSRAQKE